MAGQSILSIAEETPSLEVVESDYLIEISQSVGPAGVDGAQGEQGEPGADGAGATAESMGALIASAAEKATPVDADMIGLMDSAASNILKKLSWANIKSTLQTYFAALFQPINQPVFEHGTLTGASPEAVRTFGPIIGGAGSYPNHTATIGENVTAILSGFTLEQTSIALLLTVSSTATLALSGGTWTVWTTQTLTTMAAGTYLIIFKSVDSGVTGLVTVMVQP